MSRFVIGTVLWAFISTAVQLGSPAFWRVGSYRRDPKDEKQEEVLVLGAGVLQISA